MTDQTIPDVTDDDRKLAREWAEGIAHDMDNWGDGIRTVARVVLDAVPAPPRPTLADMTLDEQDECAGMQADLAQGDRVAILDGTPDHDGLVQVLEKSLDVYRPSPEDVTPRPDLPRLEWPGDKKAEDVAPTKVGDVIESAADPRLAALPTGSALLDCDGEAVAKRGEVWVGDGFIPVPEDGGEFGPWKVLHIPKEGDQ